MNDLVSRHVTGPISALLKVCMFWVQKAPVEGHMDTTNVETNSSGNASLGETRPLSTKESETAPDINSPVFEPQAVGSESHQNTLTKEATNEAHVLIREMTEVYPSPFRSLQEFDARRKRFNGNYVTDEPASMDAAAAAAARRNKTSSQSTYVNSTRVPFGHTGGFFTLLPLSTSISGFGPARYIPSRSYTLALFPTVSLDLTKAVRSKHISTELDSLELKETQASPNPCEGLRSGPHEPPRPAEPYQPTHKAAPAIFHDQFVQFMEDRMVMFRPTSSQNSVEQTLSLNHPYQRADEAETARMRSWFTMSSNRNNHPRVSPVNEPTPVVSVDSPVSAFPPMNNSTSSFLPRGVQGPCCPEPLDSGMSYIPRAVPLADVKRPPLSPIASQCMCVWWPF